jgi:hypothetical protein
MVNWNAHDQKVTLAVLGHAPAENMEMHRETKRLLERIATNDKKNVRFSSSSRNPRLPR